jgi:SAM-dependent methyltransferase
MDPIARDYDALAQAYRREVGGELEHKPMDRAWLRDFAARIPARGLVADAGCGPGHVSALLAAAGVRVVGLDLSPRMVAEAEAAYPALAFELGDLRALDARPGRFAGVLAMYSLIHLRGDDLHRVLAACHSALVPGGEFRAAIHLGEGVLRPGAMWGVPVELEFRLFAPGELDAALVAAGFTVTESRARPPYAGAEYPTQRGYLVARR